MKDTSFLDIQHFSKLIDQNELFSQYMNSELPDRYDSNFMLLHFNPILEEFLLIENIQRNHQIDSNQQHLKFKWPENIGIHLDLLNYLNHEEYKLGKEELMVVSPNQLHIENYNQEVTFEVVADYNLEDFLLLNYNEDKLNGEKIADYFQSFYPFLFNQKKTKFLLAKLGDQPVASLILHGSKNFIEIDHVLTDGKHRNKGIASGMIQYVMDELNEKQKPLILVADAEDSPKLLYEKVGFKVVSSQISIIKERLD